LATLYTIGHSTRTLEELIEVLRAHRISTLVDIRAFPAADIRYVWMKALGGYRKKILDDSPNIALRNDSFRNYADYMMTAEFAHAMDELVRLAGEAPTAYMCAERVYFHCHRMLVSDWLVAHGHEVQHIDGMGPVRPHKLMAEARIIEGRLIYRGDRLL
jgi:uncharacterized protein (DUF488 family)